MPASSPGQVVVGWWVHSWPYRPLSIFIVVMNHNAVLKGDSEDKLLRIGIRPGGLPEKLVQNIQTGLWVKFVQHVAAPHASIATAVTSRHPATVTLNRPHPGASWKAKSNNLSSIEPDPQNSQRAQKCLTVAGGLI